jgi:hypothetical protein
MEATWDERIAGVFQGYHGGLVHEPSEGLRWRQAHSTNEYLYRERPKARLLLDRGTGQTYLDVEGTSGAVRVVPDSGMCCLSAGAFWITAGQRGGHAL